MATLREHIQAESAHDMEGVLHGFTGKCFNDIACVPKPFVGRKKVAERYRKHWEGFPDFKVRVRRLLAVDDKCIVTENEWTGTHRGPFAGMAPTGRRVSNEGIVIYRMEDGKIAEAWSQMNRLGVLQQIGALP